jgi:hypothetical protein
MAELRCEMCGKPGQDIGLGARLCLACQDCYAVERCPGCGERVMYHRELRGTIGPGGVCFECHMRDRLSRGSEDDLEVIRAEAQLRGPVAGVREMRRLLGWSIPEAVSAIEILRRGDV